MLGEDVEVTPHLQEKIARMKLLCALILEYLDDSEAMAVYRVQTGVEQAQAYRDLKDAKKISGDIIAFDRRFELLRMYAAQKRSITKAEIAGNYAAVMSGHKNIQAYIELLADGNILDLSKFKPRQVNLVFDPTLLGENLDAGFNEGETLKLIETLGKPKLNIPEDDYIEYDEIQAELGKGK